MISIIPSILRYLAVALAGLFCGWLQTHNVITKDQADKVTPQIVGDLLLLATFIGSIVWSYLQKWYNGWIVLHPGYKLPTGLQLFLIGGFALAAVSSMVGCAALPILLESAPSLIEAVSPLVEAKLKQTALNAAQRVNNGQYPTVDDLDAQLTQVGLPALTQDQYGALLEGLTAALQKLVTDAQARGETPAQIKADVSAAIVAAQKAIAKGAAQ